MKEEEKNVVSYDPSNFQNEDIGYFKIKLRILEKRVNYEIDEGYHYSSVSKNFLLDIEPGDVLEMSIPACPLTYGSGDRVEIYNNRSGKSVLIPYKRLIFIWRNIKKFEQLL